MKGILFLVIFGLFLFSPLAQNLVVDVNLTMLNVSVEDEDGHAVIGLTAKDFEVRESGQLRR